MRFMGKPDASTLTPPERRNVMAVLPYFHVYGNIVVMNWAMFSCATQIQVPRFNIDEMMNLLANFKEITFFPTVPTLINALVNHPKAGELDLAKKLKLLNSGAAPIPVELIEQIKDMGIFFSEGYGLSESTSLGISNPILGSQEGRQHRDPIPGQRCSPRGHRDGERKMSPRASPGKSS